jgi:2-hydroxychromene-2-carboxylate isomerase
MTITHEGTMSFAKTEPEWAERASRHLKAELKRAGITYAGLANLLKKHGLRDETKASVSSKLARGTFTSIFFLASEVAIGREDVRLEDI